MKMKYFDIAVCLLFVAALVLLCSFWKCEMDLYMTVLGLLVAVAAGMTTYTQYKQIQNLSVKKK